MSDLVYDEICKICRSGVIVYREDRKTLYCPNCDKNSLCNSIYCIEESKVLVKLHYDGNGDFIEYGGHFWIPTNASDLQMVTLQENIKRGKTGHHTNQHKGLNHFRRRKTHCPKGHEYNEENIYYYNGWRNCKTCISIRKKEQYRRKIVRNI